jgi:transposase-like protein
MKTEEKKQAIELRRQEGMAIPKIAKKLGVSRSSVSVWVRDVKLTQEQEKRLKDNSGNNKHLAEHSKRRKEEAKKVREGYRKEGFNRAKTDDMFRVICGIYWGDGSKGRHTFGVSNCDCRMINIVGKWLIEEVDKDKIGFKIQCPDETTKDNNELLKWWSANLEFLEDSMIKKTIRYKINRASQWKRVDKQPNGTAVIYTCSTRLVQMVFGGIEYLSTL